MTWDVILRLVNATGCLLALWFLAQSAFYQWKSWTVKTQDHWWALAGWVFLGMEGSIESLVLHTQPGPRTILQTLVVAFTMRALLRSGEINAESTIPWRKKEL